jgi:hypothetical protein
MRVVAVIASYNEERFIDECLAHYEKHGVEVYLLDNDSTDNTVNIAKKYLERNLIAIEKFPRKGVYEWSKILRKKEQIIDSINADWFIHADPDEFRLPPSSNQTLAEAIADVDRQGYNAINFMEYTFIPTKESPDHFSDRFIDTMRWYYPFGPQHPHRLNAWKKQSRKWHGLKSLLREMIKHHRLGVPSVDLTSSGGHIVNFDGIKQYPVDFKMRHYLVLSLEHAINKYVKKDFDPDEIEGSHGWRATATEHDFLLPSETELRLYIDDDHLDASFPESTHIIARNAAN